MKGPRKGPFCDMKPIPRYSQTIPPDKKAWFLVVRFIIPALLIGSGLVFLRPITFNFTLLAVYGVLALTLLAYTIITRNGSGSFVRGLVITLIASELLIEGLLVNHVGGNFSPFVIFFIVTIVTASLFFHLLGSIVVATIAGLLYSLPIFLDLSVIYEGLIEPTRLAGLGMSSDEAFYTVFLHLCLFYFSAFISGYLAQNLLWASRELTQIRLETNEILEQMHSGLFTIDSRGRVVHFNKAAGEILGVGQAHARGKLMRDVFHSGLDEFTQKIESVLSNRKSELRAEINIRHPEKGTVPIGLSCSVPDTDEGAVRGVIAVFQDLTEAKKLDAHLRANDRLAAVGRLAAGIAHEIRNPLASISGSVEVLKDDLDLEGDDLRLLELILKESSRLNTILTDFLNFARVTRTASGGCDLAPVIAEVVTLLSTHHIIAGVNITQKIHRPRIDVSGSEDQLKQILWNLLLNAAQALAERGGEILVTTDDFIDPDKSGMVRLVIADNGPGIPIDAREKIFEPFFSTKQGGTGLGLPLVARIIDCLGGRLELESSPEWVTMFIVYLPVASLPAKDQTALRVIAASSVISK